MGDEKIYTEMKELIDLLEQKVKDNVINVTAVEVDGRYAFISIGTVIDMEQIGRLVGILELQIRQNNYDAKFSMKP